MSSIAGKKIVVIGGNGYLGSAAVEAALKAGANVTVLSRRASSSDGAVAFQGSISDPAAVRAAIESADGIVISVEANSTPEELRSVYVDGTRNVLDAAAAGSQILFMSHIGITDVPRMPDYNQAKLKAEELIRNSGRPYTIVRPSWVVHARHGVKFEQGDRYHGRRDDIGHTDLGLAIVAAFEHPEAQGKTFELYGDGERDPNWAVEFRKLSPDK